MWAEALAVKERTKDGGSQETQWGKNGGQKNGAHNSDEAPTFFRLL